MNLSCLFTNTTRQVYSEATETILNDMWGVLQECVYGIKIFDVYDLQKCFTQTWVDF